MKLLGARFKNFACFDDCFVPLDQDILLLVGKNNAGKTAILRGLTALSALPIPGPRAMDQRLRDYCRPSPEEASFDLEVVFAAENTDANAVGRIIENAEVVSASSRNVEFRFRVFPGNGVVGLLGVEFAYKSKRLPLLERAANEVGQILYGPSGAVSGSTKMIVENEQTAANERWPVLKLNGLLSCLVELKNTRIVDPHRVVRPWQLQALQTLSNDADSLAAFLDTLNGSDRRTFRRIEEFVTSVFPEFEFVNPKKEQNGVSLTLSKRDGADAIPLSHCGTGVEQILALASFVFTSKPGTLLLMDEPHSYLHPSAERELFRLLTEHPEHRFVISTHSAILMNSVSSDRILHLAPGKVSQPNTARAQDVSEVLHSLGYRNSDLLFNDRLIFVEGDSDQEILPNFLLRSPKLRKGDIQRTGFPTMDGNGRLKTTRKQKSLLHFEKLLEQLRRTAIPRIYLFDGDCVNEDKDLLQNTPLLRERTAASVKFLPRLEIENYLLVPEAIVEAIRKLTGLEGKARAPESAVIGAQIEQLLESNDEELFPNGRREDPRKVVKASLLLERIFEDHELQYNKRQTGRLIAESITDRNQPALSEIWDLMAQIFP